MSVFADFKELYNYRELLWTWSLREITSRYKQSLFGIAWAILQPLVLTAIFVLVFSSFVQLPSDGIPYPLFIYSALLPWNFLVRSLNLGISSVVTYMGLVTKIYFPRAIFPMASVAVGFVDFLCGLIVLVGMMVYYQVALSPALAILPLLFLIQLILMMGIIFGAATINVFYRDISQLVPISLQVWMYACPIIYPISAVPDSWRPWYILNPMAVVIEGYRAVLLKGQLPDMYEVGLAMLISLIIFVSGYLIFNRLEDQFADII